MITLSGGCAKTIRAAIDTIKAQSGFDYSASWDRQQQTAGVMQGEFPQYTFIDDMWRKYHPCGSTMGIQNAPDRSVPSNPALGIFFNRVNSTVTIGLPDFSAPFDVEIYSLTGAKVASFRHSQGGKRCLERGELFKRVIRDRGQRGGPCTDRADAIDTMIR